MKITGFKILTSCQNSVNNIEYQDPVASRFPDGFYTALPLPESAPTTQSQSNSLVLAGYAEDDSDVRSQPTRFVDYLSHNWKDEDIWLSWKYVVSDRKLFDHGVRLQNTSWRTWTKMKNKLTTVSPETIDWTKDDDVTCLYGPLQTRHPQFYTNPSALSGNRKPQSATPSNAKSILKNRSVLESMLERSLFTISLRRHQATSQEGQSIAAAAPLQPNNPSIEPGTCNDDKPFILPTIACTDDINSQSSIEWPDIVSSPKEKKLVHFNESVEQRIPLALDHSSEGDSDTYSVYNHSPRENEGVAEGISEGTKTLAMLPPRNIEPEEYTSKPNQIWSLGSFPSALDPNDDQLTSRMREALSRSWMSPEEIEDEVISETLFGETNAWK